MSAPSIPGLLSLDPSADPTNLLSSLTMGTEVEVCTTAPSVTFQCTSWRPLKRPSCLLLRCVRQPCSTCLSAIDVMADLRGHLKRPRAI